MIRALALALTALTGFSGLVYEVAWQKYLATLLGSHSEATAAVLGIFLGGLSVGYWLFGRVTRRVVERAANAGRPPRLLSVYGLLEAGIGVYVIAFPWLFEGVQALSYSLPSFGGETGGVGFAIDVLLSALLIGPASVLMGGTIPMLTQALARSLDDATRFHAFVYAFNTAGAFAGALAAGFYLVPVLGLEVVMRAMGCVNLAAGAIFIGSGLSGRSVISLAREEAGARIEGFRIYATVALLTGFAMMTMQTAFIRIGMLAIGSSQFTFSMVVAVFVLAIALGSFVVSAFSSIPRIVIVVNQCGIAVFFLLLYPRLDEASYFAMLIRSLFSRTDQGFYGYYFFLFLSVLAVIGLPVLLSGAALPLLFHHMRRQVGHLGDLAGSLYSWNTVGSLLGALLGGYALLFWFDLHEVYRIALAALAVAATMLAMQIYHLRKRTALVLVPLLGALFLLPAWRPNVLYTGLFRLAPPTERLLVGAEQFITPRGGLFVPKILFQTDDPTSSVVVREMRNPGQPYSRSLSINAKIDGDSYIDYSTTGLLAVLPAMMAKKLESAFVIGWGLGTTAGELGSFETVQRVDVAEISPGVLEAAPLFDFATEGATKNPKIHVIESDAYRALMRTNVRYDVIVSEPSHVWVSGIEMLFSSEFLEATKARLNPGGVFCMWIHRYEFDDEGMQIALRTFSGVFEHAAVWQDVTGSLIVLGFLDPSTGSDHFRFAQNFERPDFRATLKRSRIPSLPALLAHELLPVGVLHAANLEGPIQSLYHPRLNARAARALFRGDYAELPFTGYGEPARIGAKHSLLRGYASRFGGGLPDDQRAEMIREACRSVGRPCNALMAEWLHEGPTSKTFEDTLAWVERHRKGLPRERLQELGRLFDAPQAVPEKTSPYQAQSLTDAFLETYHHAAPYRGDALVDVWLGCREGLPSEAACREYAGDAMLGTPDASLSYEERVAQCLAGTGIGHQCQSGYEEARRLVEQGPRAAAISAAR